MTICVKNGETMVCWDILQIVGCDEISQSIRCKKHFTRNLNDFSARYQIY